MEQEIPKYHYHRLKAPPTTMLFVSLCMVMLSFFIIMVSISEQQGQKAKQVAEAVQHSFQRVLPFPDILSPAGNEQERIRQGFFDAVRNDITTRIPAERSSFMESDDFLYIRLPVSELFAPEAAPVRQDREEMFQSLARLTSRYHKAHQVGFTFYHPAQKEASPLIYERLGRIAKSFENHGVPTSAITVGVHEGQQDLLIVFHFVTEEEKP